MSAVCKTPLGRWPVFLRDLPTAILEIFDYKDVARKWLEGAGHWEAQWSEKAFRAKALWPFRNVGSRFLAPPEMTGEGMRGMTGERWPPSSA